MHCASMPLPPVVALQRHVPSWNMGTVASALQMPWVFAPVAGGVVTLLAVVAGGGGELVVVVGVAEEPASALPEVEVHPTPLVLLHMLFGHV